MRVFATYDDAGQIVGLAVAAADVRDGEFALDDEPGIHVSEIEVPDSGRTPPETVIADLIQNFRVARAPALATFVRRTPPVS
jgi:hypothetical protein